MEDSSSIAQRHDSRYYQIRSQLRRLSRSYLQPINLISVKQIRQLLGANQVVTTNRSSCCDYGQPAQIKQLFVLNTICNFFELEWNLSLMIFFFFEFSRKSLCDCCDYWSLKNSSSLLCCVKESKLSIKGFIYVLYKV